MKSDELDVMSVGKVFRKNNDNQNIWTMLSWCEIPTFTFENVKTGKRETYTVAQMNEVNSVFDLLSAASGQDTEKE